MSVGMSSVTEALKPEEEHVNLLNAPSMPTVKGTSSARPGYFPAELARSVGLRGLQGEM